jgi:hypothetical protein
VIVGGGGDPHADGDVVCVLGLGLHAEPGVLFALIFSIGILVDDAIVVVENIHRHQHCFPISHSPRSFRGAVDEVGGPTILATLTVIAALLPMAFVSGLMGPYMSPIPINSSLGMAIVTGDCLHCHAVALAQTHEIAWPRSCRCHADTTPKGLWSETAAFFYPRTYTPSE